MFFDPATHPALLLLYPNLTVTVVAVVVIGPMRWFHAIIHSLCLVPVDSFCAILIIVYCAHGLEYTGMVLSESENHIKAATRGILCYIFIRTNVSTTCIE